MGTQLPDLSLQPGGHEEEREGLQAQGTTYCTEICRWIGTCAVQGHRPAKEESVAPMNLESFVSVSVKSVFWHYRLLPTDRCIRPLLAAGLRLYPPRFCAHALRCRKALLKAKPRLPKVDSRGRVLPWHDDNMLIVH